MASQNVFEPYSDQSLKEYAQSIGVGYTSRMLRSTVITKIQEKHNNDQELEAGLQNFFNEEQEEHT